MKPESGLHNPDGLNPKTSFYDFCRVMFYEQHGFLMRENYHQKVICDKLEEVVLGKCRRLIINIPPRSGKTEIVSKLFVAWCMGLNPASQFILTSYSKRLATQNTYAARDIMLSPFYRSLWANPKCDIKGDSKAKDEFKTVGGGIVYAEGAGGTITGYGAGGMGKDFAGAIIIDDIQKPSEAMSKILREKANEWFSNTIESRKNSPYTPIIVIGQRLHEDDLSGFLLNGGNGEEWDLLKIPAIIDGKSFWEEQYPIASLTLNQKASPYVFGSQYMQEPSPKGGLLFQVDNIVRIDESPECKDTVRAWDLASTANGGDYTVGVKMGRIGDKFYVLDVVRGQWGSNDRNEKMIDTAHADGVKTKIWIPQDPGGAGKSLAESMIAMLAGFSVKAKTVSGDKETRADPLSSQLNAGNVYVVEAPWTNEFIEELRLFPNGKHDDQVDAAADSFNSLTKKRNNNHTAQSYSFGGNNGFIR